MQSKALGFLDALRKAILRNEWGFIQEILALSHFIEEKYTICKVVLENILLAFNANRSDRNDDNSITYLYLLASGPDQHALEVL